MNFFLSDIVDLLSELRRDRLLVFLGGVLLSGCVHVRSEPATDCGLLLRILHARANEEPSAAEQMVAKRNHPVRIVQYLPKDGQRLRRCSDRMFAFVDADDVHDVEYGVRVYYYEHSPREWLYVVQEENIGPEQNSMVMGGVWDMGVLVQSSFGEWAVCKGCRPDWSQELRTSVELQNGRSTK